MKTEQIKYIWEVSHGQRGRILLSCLTGIIGVAVSLAFIYASKVVIDIATGAVIGSLTNAAILTIALLIAQLLCGAIDTWLSARMQVETGNALRHRLFSRLLQSRWNELERFHTGDIVNRVEQDTAAIVGVAGVVNATNVQLNGGTADLLLTETGETQQVPVIGTVTLNESN